MTLKSNIRWGSLLSYIILFLFFTLPLLMLTVHGLLANRSSSKFWTILAAAAFAIPIGVMPIHLWLNDFVLVRCTESGIVLTKYFGLWRKQYTYADLRAYARNSYQRSKGSAKRYAVLNVLCSNGKVPQINEKYMTNYQEICKQVLTKAQQLVEDKKLVPDDSGLRIWLAYIGTSVAGVLLALLAAKLGK